MTNELYAVLYGALQEFVDALDEETKQELIDELFNRKYARAEKMLEIRKRLRTESI